MLVLDLVQWQPMEVYHLRYFVAVAENLSFSGAAKSLHMATSPLSQRIKDLERELGLQLFERNSRNVSLTVHGRALLPMARQTLTDFDTLGIRLKQLDETALPRFSIGVPPWLHPKVDQALSEFAFENSHKFTIERWPGGSSDLVRAVQSKVLGFALVHLPAQGADVMCEQIFSEDVGILLPSRRFPEKQCVSISDLSGMVFVKPPMSLSPTYFEQIAVRLTAAGLVDHVTLSSGDYSSPAELVANGNAFALTTLDHNAHGDMIRQGLVTALPFSDFAPKLATGLVMNTSSESPESPFHDLVAAARNHFRIPIR
ncbi:LysR family transcriptional regulator [Kocuria sp. TGY1127_2]|uniref:LysR family transcriptional regulator n=1 Tax=Kocuria sp. TGY1127_2 TaxID=2711328 RepID=UPI0015BAFC27|nr:LysR family transcriptional regulator [Kocuria sp. TGY1127_2]